MSEFSIRNIGLNQEEAEALFAAAMDRYDEVKAAFSEYERGDEGRCATAAGRLVRAGEIGLDDAMDLVMLYQLTASHPKAFLPLDIQPKIDDRFGFFTRHESFACMSNHTVSSTKPVVVGTPTLDTNVVNLRFHRAELNYDASKGDMTPSLRDYRRMGEINLSACQFAQLLRNREAGSPCAIGRTELDIMDRPPRLVQTVVIAKQVREEALDIVRPLTVATRDLRNYLLSDEKISTKADHAKVKELADAVAQAMNDVRAPLRELLARTAGLMAEASIQQVIAEIQEPLFRLGMDGVEVGRLMKL